MAARNKPQAEVEIDIGLVASLIADQHPDLSALPLNEAGSGWDNAMFRLGEDLLVRLPRRAVAADLVRHEQLWLPRLADSLPVPVPAPVRVGRPDDRYPWPWSIVPWARGVVLGADRPIDQMRLAQQLGEFFSALHREAPPDAPSNPLRGVPLANRDARFRESVELLDDRYDTQLLLAAWEEALASPDGTGPPLWLHGDIHGLNLIVDESGNLASVIDFGDITSGDPSTDLSVAWTILDEEARESLRSTSLIAGLSIDNDTWARARGWALNFAVLYLANSADVPVLSEIGEGTLSRLRLLR